MTNNLLRWFDANLTALDALAFVFFVICVIGIVMLQRGEDGHDAAVPDREARRRAAVRSATDVPPVRQLSPTDAGAVYRVRPFSEPAAKGFGPRDRTLIGVDQYTADERRRRGMN